MNIHEHQAKELLKNTEQMFQMEYLVLLLKIF